MKIRKLKSIRLVLIVVAVVLALAIAAVKIFWIPASVEPELPTRETSGVNSTQPDQTTIAPSPDQTLPQPTQESAPQEGENDFVKPQLPAPNVIAPEEGKDSLTDVLPDPVVPESEEHHHDAGSAPQEGTKPENGNEAPDQQGGSFIAAAPMLPQEPMATEGSDASEQAADGVASVTPALASKPDDPQPGALEGTPEEGSEAMEEPAAATGETRTEETSGDNFGGILETEGSEPAEQEPKKGEELLDKDVQKSSSAQIVLYVLWGLLAADIAAIVWVTVLIRKNVSDKKEKVNAAMNQAPQEQTLRSNAKIGEIQVGQLHNIGARPYQEDSSGVSMLDDGILAVVADGMGGLSGGDKVSQKIVYSMLTYGDQLRPGYIDGALERMVHATNDAVNKMLGPEGLYKSGSTLLAVLARGNRFHWIAVGDSHIYYHHNGHLVQLNEEHNRGQELLHKAARGEITYEEARNDPKKNGLTSFIGMGRLKYIDKSLDSIPVAPGDRILLMTDGVFNALPDQTIEAVLNQYPNVQQAAAELERLVIQRANPRQDNFTAVIIGF